MATKRTIIGADFTVPNAALTITVEKVDGQDVTLSLSVSCPDKGKLIEFYFDPAKPGSGYTVEAKSITFAMCLGN